MLFPEASSILSGSYEFRSSGGWLLGASKSLLLHRNVKLIVVTESPLVNKLTKLEGKEITYFIIPVCRNKRKRSNYITFWQTINSEVNPDIVHIHGTEYSSGYEYMQACGTNKVVISIQGLMSACGNYYNYGISNIDIFLSLTLRDLIKGTLWMQKRRFIQVSKIESAMIRNAHHIIGRTSWDKERVWAINPNAQYHFCNEILRDEFYDGSLWDYNKCIKHSIFLSQAGYPIKGLHQLLKAMPIILNYYPDTVIRIAGNDILTRNCLFDYFRFSGYAKYIKRLIKKLNLESHVIFTGNLNAEGMKREYLSANIFVCPSSIENSPNSLGEAQILGTPCVASYVGGVSDMMSGCENNLYRYEDIDALAYKICNVFAEQRNANIQVVANALNRHDSVNNTNQLFSVYERILNENQD